MDTQVITTDILRGEQNTHGLPDAWLGARVRGWMFEEARGAQWWICALQMDGKWRYASFPEPCLLHNDHREMARKICRFVNKCSSHGGAWLAGWIGQQFYLLWKDRDGDLQIVEEFPLPMERLKAFEMEDFAEHCEQMIAKWKEWMYGMEHSRNQRVRLAQGESISAAHAVESSRYSLTPN